MSNVFIISAMIKKPSTKEMYLATTKLHKCYWTDSYLDENTKKFETMYEAAQFFATNKVADGYQLEGKPMLKQISTVEVGPL